MKTNAARLLDRLGIRHEPRDDEFEGSRSTAATVALKVGLPRNGSSRPW